jgi:glycosyltransferase involved in cell wall biosynthesis
MRIGMMADVYKPHVSGITNYIALNKRHLEAQGHEVFVFTFGDEDYPDDEPNVIRSPGLPILDTGYYISFSYNQQAQRLLRTMDLVHVHHPFLSGSLALRYCRPRAIPVVFTNHTRYDLYAQAYLPNMPDVIGERALAAYLPAFCRNCDMVISPSAGMRDILRSFGVDATIDVVPNGVHLEPFRRPQCRQERAAFGFSREDTLLIYTGRLGPEKNLEFLLRSFSGAAQAYDHLGLILVGDGPLRESLRERVASMGLEARVRFTGMLPYEELPGYLAMADAFVTASVTEVHPLSVIEAMAAGLPVLGTQSPGVSDTVEDGLTGFLVPSEDMAAFTAKMVRMVTDPDQRREMGRRAAQAADAYAIERTTKMMLERYRKVIGQVGERKRSFRVRMRRVVDGWLR